MATLVQQRPRRRRALGTIGYVVFLGVVLAAAMFGGWISKSKVLSGMIKRQFGFGESPTQTFNSNQLTLLILGCDEDRQYTGYHQSKVLTEGARSDMMLVAKLDFAKNSVSGLSIPRDMWCRVDGTGHKMNAFYKFGGTPLAKRAVETLTGIPIDRVVVINFDEFQKLVSLVGGVDVNVDKDLDYDDFAGNLHIHLKQGQQHLDGNGAMGFVRYRHGDDDFQRQARQKQFLMAFKGAALSHWSNLPAIAEQAVQVLGGALQDDEVAALAMFAKGVPQSNIKMGAVPAVDPDENPMHLDKRGLKKALAQFGFTAAGNQRVAAR